jgi:hypothetical protein
MYLDNYGTALYEFRKKSFTFNPSYRYWVNTLLEYPMRLFSYEGLPETVPAHIVDIMSYIRGYAAVVRLSSGEWICASESSLNGVTDYYDVFKNVTFSTPLHFGTRTIGKTGFVIRNTSLMQPLMPKIERYATMLAHTEISLICELVNLRETDVIEAITEAAAKSADKQARDRYNGEIQTLVNEGFAMLRHNFVPQKSQNENMRIWDLRSNILGAYLEEIGIKKAQNKREREISQEVAADDPMLKLNVSDMLEVKQQDWQKFNDATGYNVRVTCNIDYLSQEGKEVDINGSTVQKGEGSQTEGDVQQ